MRRTAGAGIVLAVAAGAWFGPFGDGKGVRENVVSLDEWSITGDLEIAVGTTLRVENSGTIRHDLVLDTSRTPWLEPGESADLDLGSLAPGTYEVWCSLPHHRAEGMAAQLTVAEADDTARGDGLLLR